jgi:RNA recognition motif-containing protein
MQPEACMTTKATATMVPAKSTRRKGATSETPEQPEKETSSAADKDKICKKQKPSKKKRKKSKQETDLTIDQRKENELEVGQSAKQTKVESQDRSVKLSAPSERDSPVKDTHRSINDGSDDDDDLLAAAAKWADNEEKVGGNNNFVSKSKKDRKRNGVSLAEANRMKPVEDASTISSSQQPQSLSLHITQLPFDSSELDLRKFFAEHGCRCTSIRLVYDRDVQGHKTVFRGVAFVDLADAASYEAALKLNHKASIRGRRLNIRPTRSKQELADIVTKTKEMVQEKIRLQRSGEAGADSSTPKNDDKDKKKRPRTNDKDKESGPKKRKDAPKNEDGTIKKLTKKERNRKAAIIRGLKGKRKGQKR